MNLLSFFLFCEFVYLLNNQISFFDPSRRKKKLNHQEENNQSKK